MAPSIDSALPLLRLMQVTDSAFPVGGFSFSHGVEWLVQRGGAVDEARLRSTLQVYVQQVVGGQALPSALAAARARTTEAVARVDRMLDASILPEAEREAGRLMGERLLAGATQSFGGSGADGLLRAVRDGLTPGQYATAFGVIARDHGVPDATFLAALGSSMVGAVAQSAVRLTVIGQAAAARLVAGAAPDLDAAIATTLARGRRHAVGAFAPGLDLAGLLHHTLPFRTFAS